MAGTSANLHQIGFSLHQRFKKDTDIHYPKSLSVQPRLSLTTECPHSSFITKVLKKDLKRISRHRTQPLTFDEIKEVDEENLEDIQLQSKGLDRVRMNLLDFSNVMKDGSAFRNTYRYQNTSVGTGPICEDGNKENSKEV